MNSFRRSRIQCWLMALLCAGTSAVSVWLAYRGEWSRFGAFLAGLPSVWKSPGYRSAYLSHWALPLFLSYAIVLCGSIFLGLRRLKRDAR